MAKCVISGLAPGGMIIKSGRAVELKVEGETAIINFGKLPRFLSITIYRPADKLFMDVFMGTPILGLNLPGVGGNHFDMKLTETGITIKANSTRSGMFVDYFAIL